MLLNGRNKAIRETIFLFLLTPAFFLGANEMEVNNEAKKVIYQYAEIIDSRRFDELDSIMWPDFSMSGGYDLNGIDGFMGAMNYLVTTYDRTMHFIGNVEGTWDGDVYNGNWNDNQRHGKGIQKLADGHEYIGEFKEGKFSTIYS